MTWIRTILLTLAAAAIAFTAQQLGDYPVEAATSLEAVARGDLGGFASAATPYAGSLTLRAPFVAVAGALGGDRLDLYHAGVFACLLGAVALAVVLDRAAAGRPWATRLATAAAVLALPVVLDALDMGHPEEVLTGALAVLAVWAAPRRPLAAGVLLGVAVACKPWALVALGPVLLCAEGGRLRLLPRPARPAWPCSRRSWSTWSTLGGSPRRRVRPGPSGRRSICGGRSAPPTITSCPTASAASAPWT